MSECQAQNTWKDSGDRGAARAEHDRSYHPDHEHMWGDTSYTWEDPTVQRCGFCALRATDDQRDKCSPLVYM